MQEHEYLANTEEADLIDYFASVPSGFFVEVGANGPFDLSVSWPFERAGWKGILIEPIPECAELLRTNRAATVVECACTSPNAPDTAILTIQSESGVSSSMADEFVFKGESNTINVKCRTLDSILKEHDVKKINLLSIDVEGFEYEVLKGLDLKIYRPDLIFIEDHMHYNYSHLHLIKNDYKIIRRTGTNNWYIPNNFNYDLSIFEQLYLYKKTTITPMKNQIKRLIKKILGRS
jgi:FkbM family methyltransferase